MKTFLFLTAILGALSSFAREKKLVLHNNGKVQYEYELEGFMLDGRFTCYYETGKLRIKGQFSNNQKTGLWRYWDEKGLLRAERNYSDNQHFTVISQRDSSGNKIKLATEEDGRPLAVICDFSVANGAPVLFSHRYVSAIAMEDPANRELFVETGLAGNILKKINEKKIVAFADDRFTQPVNLSSVSGFVASDVVSFLIKEDYVCVSTENPVVFNKVIGVCPIVIQKGVRKELGWIYVPDLDDADTKDQLTRIRNHQYKTNIIKTTINDPSFKLRDVSAKESETLHLALLEIEANTILYMLDNNQALATNQ